MGRGSAHWDPQQGRIFPSHVIPTLEPWNGLGSFSFRSHPHLPYGRLKPFLLSCSSIPASKALS